MLTVTEARFITSAPDIGKAPDLKSIPEIVLVGRSNVGKSTFINVLTNRKNLARTSNTPGKTRLINFYAVTLAQGKSTPKLHPLALVDLPGYGYAKVSKTEQEHWRLHLTRFLKQRAEIALCIQLIDARHGPQESDISMFDWLARHEIPQLLIVTKTDKLDNKRELPKALAQTAERLGIDDAHVIPFSSVKTTNTDTLWTLILEALAN